MRPRAYLDFVRDRVLAHIAANRSAEPLLGEPDTSITTCAEGHTNMGLFGGAWRCLTCLQAVQAAARRRKRAQL